MKKNSREILVRGLKISIISADQNDFICITDIAKSKNPTEPKDVIKNWMRSRSTIEFLGLWEKINNPDFKGVEFDPLLFEAGSNSFTLSPTKWIETVNAIGITSSKGRNGGTYAHKDIAFEFASWVSAEFKLYLIKEFQRLKEEEALRLSEDWNLHRTLSKLNYRIHTDAIKEHLIPQLVNKEQQNYTYATEADLLNVALFGKTAKQWREENPNKEGNIRDYSTVEQLLVLANIESMNAEFIRMELPQSDRLVKLNAIAISQLKSLSGLPDIKRLKS